MTGSLAGTPLRLLPTRQTKWAEWKKQHPQTLVLSFRTGHQREYLRDPYQDLPLDRAPALVVSAGGETKIYPFRDLKKARGNAGVEDRVGGERITIELDARRETAEVRGLNGRPVPSFVAFLVDARAFYPNAPIFRAGR